jgi:hypothetical protein
MGMVGRIRQIASLTLLPVVAGLSLAACGGGTKTVTAASVPAETQARQATEPQRQGRQSTQATQPQAEPGRARTPPASSSTRSAPEPAFTKEEAKAGGASSAAAVVRAHGYTPSETAEYHSGQALAVLVGTRTGSADGYGQQAFFFVNGRYLGTDTKLPSATVKVLGQGDTEVTLGYPLYRRGDPLASPSGGEARVTFQLNDGKLVPLQKIPPAESSTGLSRH